jgi:hypothetical protein
MVIDSESGKTIADIPGQKIAHGVALAPEAGRGFITDGGGNGAIVIFDLKTNAILGSIVAQPDADGIIFDPASGRVVVVSGDKGVLMSIKPDIDPKSGKIDALLDLGGAPEFLASDGAGKVYVNLMDKNEVAVVDMPLAGRASNRYLSRTSFTRYFKMPAAGCATIPKHVAALCGAVVDSLHPQPKHTSANCRIGVVNCIRTTKKHWRAGSCEQRKMRSPTISTSVRSTSSLGWACWR